MNEEIKNNEATVKEEKLEDVNGGSAIHALYKPMTCAVCGHKNKVGYGVKTATCSNCNAILIK